MDRHIRTHQVKIGKNWGFLSMCGVKVKYASTAPRLDLGIPANDYCTPCLENMIARKERQIEMLREILTASRVADQAEGDKESIE